MKFEIAMTLKELKMRTAKSAYKPVEFLARDSKELKELTEEDFKVLKHLTRAAKIIDDIYMQLNNEQNSEFLAFFNEEIEKGNLKAVLAKRMFLSQKGIFSPDSLGNQTVLLKNINKPLGLGFYPQDLTSSEFAKIINEMLNKNKIKEVKAILSNRSKVVRDGSLLKGIDIVDFYQEKFKAAALEIKKAAIYSDDKEFNNYLRLQALAFENADIKLDAEADKKWATLENTKFEFTVTRECYNEKMTITLLEDENLAKRLKELGIEIRQKDEIGARVGLVNKKGTKFLKDLKSLVDISSKYMPYKDEYENICETENISQTAVDVDLVWLSGDEGAYRASIVTAQNLPNDDKYALKIGGGRRNVYHRQVRKRKNKKLYKNLICENQFKYFSPEADHWAVICHENTHTLGPKNHEKLAEFNPILEEFKADMGMYAFLDEFKCAKMFNEEQIKQIMVSSLACSFLKGKPSLSQAHRTRSVMICHRMLSEKAIILNNENKLEFDFEKIKKVTKTMMKEVVRIQIDNEYKSAKNYVEKWFVWSDELQKIAEIIKQNSKMLNGFIKAPLAEEFLEEIRYWFLFLFYWIFFKKICFFLLNKII